MPEPTPKRTLDPVETLSLPLTDAQRLALSDAAKAAGMSLTTYALARLFPQSSEDLTRDRLREDILRGIESSPMVPFTQDDVNGIKQRGRLRLDKAAQDKI